MNDLTEFCIITGIPFSSYISRKDVIPRRLYTAQSKTENLKDLRETISELTKQINDLKSPPTVRTFMLHVANKSITEKDRVEKLENKVTNLIREMEKYKNLTHKEKNENKVTFKPTLKQSSSTDILAILNTMKNLTSSIHHMQSKDMPIKATKSPSITNEYHSSTNVKMKKSVNFLRKSQVRNPFTKYVNSAAGLDIPHNLLSRPPVSHKNKLSFWGHTDINQPSAFALKLGELDYNERTERKTTMSPRTRLRPDRINFVQAIKVPPKTTSKPFTTNQPHSTLSSQRLPIHQRQNLQRAKMGPIRYSVLPVPHFSLELQQLENFNFKNDTHLPQSYMNNLVQNPSPTLDENVTKIDTPIEMVNYGSLTNESSKADLKIPRENPIQRPGIALQLKSMMPLVMDSESDTNISSSLEDFQIESDEEGASIDKSALFVFDTALRDKREKIPKLKQEFPSQEEINEIRRKQVNDLGLFHFPTKMSMSSAVRKKLQPTVFNRLSNGSRRLPPEFPSIADLENIENMHHNITKKSRIPFKEPRRNQTKISWQRYNIPSSSTTSAYTKSGFTYEDAGKKYITLLLDSVIFFIRIQRRGI